MTKRITIADFLTDAEIKKAALMYEGGTFDSGRTFADRCAAEIIEPVIGRINAKLGQENDPRFLAYCVEYAMMQARTK